MFENGYARSDRAIDLCDNPVFPPEAYARRLMLEAGLIEEAAAGTYYLNRVVYLEWGRMDIHHPQFRGYSLCS